MNWRGALKKHWWKVGSAVLPFLIVDLLAGGPISRNGGRLITWCWGTAKAHTGIPYGLFVALALATGVLFFLIGRSVVQRPPAHVRRYREDAFEGVTWRWRYAGREKGYGIRDLHMYCPRCTNMLVFTGRERRGGYPEPINATICQNCRTTVDTPNELDKSALWDLVLRFIQRKIDRGEWREDYPPNRIMAAWQPLHDTLVETVKRVGAPGNKSAKLAGECIRRLHDASYITDEEETELLELRRRRVVLGRHDVPWETISRQTAKQYEKDIAKWSAKLAELKPHDEELPVPEITDTA